MMFSYVTVLLLSYLFGAIPFGLLIGKMYGKDVRREGSGNIGATNVTRVVGVNAGRVCFLLDFLKGVLPVLAADQLNDPSGAAGILAGAAAVLGHVFPVYLRFRGGKGVSTAAGAALALAPPAFLSAAAVWIALFAASRYVSLASIAAALCLPLSATVLSVWRGNVPVLTVVFFYVVGAAAVWNHRANIRRLRSGTELRFDRKRKGAS